MKDGKKRLGGHKELLEVFVLVCVCVTVERVRANKCI